MIKFFIFVSLFLYTICLILPKTSLVNHKFITRECRQNNCTEPLNECILDECNSERECRICINLFHPECNSCVDGIFNSTPEVINGQEYQLCDSSSEMQVKACEFYCRAMFKTKGVCEIIQGVDVCNCNQALPTTRIYTTRLATTRASGSLIRTLTNHTGAVYALELLSNGYLASGSRDKTIKIWNPYSGELVSTLYGHTADVDSLLLLENGLLASGSDDKSIILWNAQNHSQVRSFKTDGVVLALEELRNNLIAAGESNNVTIIDYKTGEIKRKLIGHSNIVKALKLLRGGFLASSAEDRTIRIWDLDTYNEIHTLTGHNLGVMALEELTNGYLASGGWDGRLIIWNPNTGATVYSRTFTSYVLALKLLESKNLAVGFGSEIHIVNHFTLATITVLTGHSFFITSFEILSNGDLASGSDDRTIKIWYP